MLQIIYLVLYKAFCFYHYLKKPYFANIPIISVGNITTGGTGKTPLVSWLVSFLQKQGFSPIILTRGYKSKGNGIRQLKNIEKKKEDINIYGDEAAMLSFFHPQVPIIIFANRVLSLKKFSHLGNIAILDDGMQQLGIKKNLDIGVIDALNGFGNKKLIPSGILREPLSALKRNDLFFLSRCNLQKNKDIIKKIVNNLPKKTSYKLDLQADYLLCSKTQKKKELKILKNKKIVLFSAIGNPKSFYYLVQEKLEKKEKIVKEFYFRDHFNYKKKDILKIFSEKFTDATTYITTMKDWVKILKWKEELPQFFIMNTKLKVPIGVVNDLKKRIQKFN